MIDFPEAPEPLPWLTTAQMIEVDRAMIEDHRIDLVQMMENAGRNLAHLARHRFLAGDSRGRRIVVLAGTGGNGGGALVSARRLSNWGARIQVFATHGRDRLAPVPRHQMEILERMRVPVHRASEVEGTSEPDLVIDGLVGYSLRGAPRGAAAQLIEWANAQTAPVLSLDEIFRIIATIVNLKHRMMIMTTYSAGLRISELTHLRCHDIDSQEMRILIRSGKGEKSRYVMLSERLLVDLREYWLAYRPGVWLFPGQDRSQPIGPKTIQRVFKRARDAAGIDKPATPHSLRHSFAVHLLEAGVNLKYIQELLGHSSIQSTLIYLKLAPEGAKVVPSPLDQLPPLPPTRQH